jgi:hypothetical protein
MYMYMIFSSEWKGHNIFSNRSHLVAAIRSMRRMFLQIRRFPSHELASHKLAQRLNLARLSFADGYDVRPCTSIMNTVTGDEIVLVHSFLGR